MKKYFFVYFCMLLLFVSCIVVNTPANRYEANLSAYKPVPVNRVRNNITYFNTHNFRKIRVNGLPIEIVSSHKSELEVSSNYIQYLRVMSYGDELYLFYDMPGTGPDSGMQRFNHQFTLHMRQPITHITAERSSRITIPDMLKAPYMNVDILIGGKVKANVQTPEINIFAEATGDFSGWIDASTAKIRLRNAATAVIGGVVGNIEVSASESSFFGGKELRADNAVIKADTKSNVSIAVNHEMDAEAINRGRIQYRPLSDIKIQQNTDSGGVIEVF